MLCMNHQCDDECRIRLDMTIDLLALSSARLKEVIHTGSEDAIESVLMELRLARMRFLEARADYRENSVDHLSAARHAT